MNRRLQESFDQLEATRQAVLSHIAGHDLARLNRPRPHGGWSALQVLHHVIAAEAGTLRYTSKKMLGGTSLPRAGLLSRLRLLSLQVAMASGLRFKAPAVAADVPDEIDPEKLRAQWEEVRKGWGDLLESFPEVLAVQFMVDGKVIGDPDYDYPYMISGDTTGLSGSFTISALAVAPMFFSTRPVTW